METKPLIIPRLPLPPGTVLSSTVTDLLAQNPSRTLNCRNWPQEYPEHPEVVMRLGHTDTEMWLRFDVAEERVAALATEPQGAVYNDSCVELFISFDNVAYYNLEMNCIGVALLGYGKSRACRRAIAPTLMQQLSIVSTLGTAPFPEKSGGFKWHLTARVPIACFEFDNLTSLTGRAARANAYKCNSGVSVKHYLSLYPIQAPAPDFHRPEFFAPVQFA